MGNDLGGLAKDILNGWLNLVVITQDRASLPLEDAFQRVVDIHNAEVASFDQIVRELPVLDATTNRLVNEWVQSLRYNVHGFTLWEATAERYQAQKAVVGLCPLVAPVVYSPQ